MGSSNNRSVYRRKRYLIVGVVIFLLINIFALGTFVLIHLASRAPLQREIIEREKTIQTMLVRMINKRIDTVIADLLHLSDLFSQNLEYSELITGGSSSENITNNWISLSNRKLHYSKIRFIDMEGMERMRVNYNADGSFLVPRSELQNKSGRYFFKEASQLDINQIYMSSADLDMDFEVIIEPIIPTLRFASPVFSEDGTKIGILMINYELTELLEAFRQIAAASDNDTYWLNQDGYYLFNQKDPDRVWGFMYEDRSCCRFANDHPEVWQRVLNTVSSDLISDDGLFINAWFRRDSYFPGTDSIEKSILTGNDRWLIISELNRDSANWYAFESSPSAILAYVIEDQKEVLLIILFVSIIFLLIWNFNTINRSKLDRFIYDHLTGALVRHSGLEKLQNQLKIAETDNSTVTICFLDINGLKEVNDTFGHESGDELIRLVADTVRSEVRHSDYLIRMGGDEFLIVFYDSDINAAAQIWQRIENSLGQLNKQKHSDIRAPSNWHTEQNKPPTARAKTKNDQYARPYLISVSHGFKELSPDSSYRLDKAISDADRLMYMEKSKIKERLQVIRKSQQADNS